MIHGGAKGVLPTQGRSGGQSVVCGVGTSLARQMNGDDRVGSRVFGMIRPGIGGGLVRDFGGLKRNRRVARTIETLWALLADAEAPVGFVAKGQNKDRVMFRLRSRRTHGRLFGRRSSWRLPIGRQGKHEETKRGDEENEPGLHRDAQVYPPGTVRIPFADWGGNYSRPRPPTGGRGICKGTASGEKVGAEAYEQKAKIILDEAKKKRNTSSLL